MRSVALVTGASGTLGRAVARELRGRGWRTVCHAFRSEVETLCCTETIRADLACSEGLRLLVERLHAGPGRLDLLVNCAGIVEENLLARTTMEAFERTLQLNLLAAIRLTRAAADFMARSGGGQVVHISSMAAETGRPGLAAYAVSKGALNEYCRSAARELAPASIRVNVVTPGFLEGGMGGRASEKALRRAKAESLLRRLTDVGESARMIAAIAETKGITGQLFHMDSRSVGSG